LKRIIAIVFLFSILFQSTSKLWILGSFYINRDYISKNICVNRFESIPTCKGQCYLNKELKENEKQEQKLPDLKQKEIQLFCEEHDSLNGTILNEIERNITINTNAERRISNFYQSIFHPPQA